MKKTIPFAPVVAAGMLTLAACSTQQPTQAPQHAAEAAMPAPVPAAVPPAPVAPAARADLRGSMKPAPVLAYSPGLPAPMPHIAPVPQSADKFPDKDGNKSVLVSDQPVSTFSVDVDTASYAFVRRMLSDGRMPPQQAVRVE